MILPDNILEFWFDPAIRDNWFRASAEFDEVVRTRLGPCHIDACAGRLDLWTETPDGALALCILFDQVPRNIFRNSVRAFESDPQARAVARQILASGFDCSYPSDDHRLFSYLPFQHSEDFEDQRLAVKLMSERTADNHSTAYARRHLEIIEKFGRFPHRNAILGRKSTSEELVFLTTPGSSF